MSYKVLGRELTLTTRCFHDYGAALCFGVSTSLLKVILKYRSCAIESAKPQL